MARLIMSAARCSSNLWAKPQTGHCRSQHTCDCTPCERPCGTNVQPKQSSQSQQRAIFEQVLHQVNASHHGGVVVYCGELKLLKCC